MILKGLTDTSLDLSEQFMLQCTANSDCDGTEYVAQAMDIILEGVPTEELYPYAPFDDQKDACYGEDKIMVTGDYEEYSGLSEEEIVTLLQEGPLVATVCADNWEYYGSGIFSCSSDSSINHFVLLVGYT